MQLRIARDCKIVNCIFFLGGGDDETTFVILDYVSSSGRSNSRFFIFLGIPHIFLFVEEVRFKVWWHMFWWRVTIFFTCL